jgi:hypothetical protein
VEDRSKEREVRTRSLVFGITLVAAVVVATIVILNAPAEDPLVTVIASKEDIPARELLDPLIERNLFKEITVPTNLLVVGAVTDVDEMRGTITTVPILANEQVSTTRLSSKDGPY